jgi:nitroreductase
METLKAITERYSVRSYQPKQIPEQALDAIITAIKAAPFSDSQNSGPLQISVIQNPDLLSELNKATDKGMLNSGDEALVMGASFTGHNPLYGAPTLILINAPSSEPHSVANACVAAENAIIAAVDQGLGSIYLSALHLAFDGNEGAVLAQKCSVPKGYTCQCAISVGYAAGSKQSFGRAPAKINYIK